MARKKKKSSWPTIIIVVVGILFYKLLSENGAPPPQAPAPAVSGFEALNTYGVSGLRDDWPNLAGGGATELQEPLAKNYYVILDDSGSMKSASCAGGQDSRLSAAIEALAVFVEGLPPRSNFGVMSFDGGRFTERLPLGRRDGSDIRLLSKRMQAGGDTPLSTAITRGYEALRRQAVAQLGYGEYHLVVITDGEASDGEYPDAILNRILSESPVDVHTIGFCIGREHVLNQPNYLSYQSADNVQALRQGLQDVLAEAPEFTVSSFK